MNLTITQSRRHHVARSIGIATTLASCVDVRVIGTGADAADAGTDATDACADATAGAAAARSDAGCDARVVVVVIVVGAACA